MKPRLWTLILPLAAGLACADANPGDSRGDTVDLAALDAVFSDFADPEGPGCAFAVARDGQQVMARAYGQANLEWDIPNTPETVFEPGSVSKQFTAAATILLALDGRIDLDDDIREHFPEDTGDVGGPEFIRLMHDEGTLDSGRRIGYAGGLRVGEYKGVREVWHSGSTAAYRGFLTRYPDHGVAVSLMCNAREADSRGLARQVAELYLADAITEASPADSAGVDVDPARVAAFAGGYRDTRTGQYLELTADGSSLRLGGGMQGLQLMAASETEFTSPVVVSIAYEAGAEGGRPAAIMNTPGAVDVRIEPVGEFSPTAADLADYVGAYRSDEAEVTYWVEVEDGSLVLKDRYGDGEALDPVYPDAFTQGGTTYIFHRGDGGRVTEASLSQGRVWHLRFDRIQ
ncbi:serine hydrolase [Candidatus Palauibacter sp.]|uniref:serine hydrolase n=1 Tax=Candidatus Palauibacter sp. TaxID=3101350 RepID=UPI003B02248A